MKARYDTICKRCFNPIKAGDEITKSGMIWVHQTCQETVVEKPAPKVAQKEIMKIEYKDVPEGHCPICTRPFAKTGDTWFHDEIQVCGTCFDDDIKRRLKPY